MDKSTTQKIKLGIFVLTGVLVFITAVYFIGAKRSLFGNTSNIYAIFNNTNGLRLGNNVRFSGINVGTVKEIQMKTDTVIILQLVIENDILKHIKSGAKAVITADGLVGNMVVNILPDHKSSRAIQAGDTLQSYSRIRTDDMLNTLSETNENAALLTVDLLKITKEIIHGKGPIAAILRDSSITKDIKSLLNNIQRTSNESVKTVEKLNMLIESLDKDNNVIGAIRDPEVAIQVKKIISNVQNSSADLNKLMANLDKTISTFDQTVLNIKDGDGLVNYLSNDATLVKQVDQTMNNLDSTVLQLNMAGIKLNESLEAVKHHWLLRSYFRKLEKSNYEIKEIKE
ncbi:MAG: MlaD family protein [Saprospiraceae bacterium]